MSDIDAALIAAALHGLRHLPHTAQTPATAQDLQILHDMLPTATDRSPDDALA